MLPELGYFLLIVASVAASVQVGLSLWGEIRQNAVFLQANPLLSGLQSLAVIAAFGLLANGFLQDDFSLIYVAQHSNSQLPSFFKFAATWGGHEGSMLFWLTALQLLSGLFCLLNRHSSLDRHYFHRTLAVLGLISLGFLLFILLESSPFERSFPPPPKGRDLNPMLQDVGLIFHPPLLYLGYVGFAVSFAMTVAALLSGNFTAFIARQIRPWVQLAWAFLTAGILLGAWWAYYELGWGGWWFWDPVENASLMPWLLGTALLHSLVVSEQRDIFHYWSILLAIFAFALSLLGTFIVRSGVLTSVHAFAVDPDRGMAILLLFFSLSFVALALFAFRANLPENVAEFGLFSKEMALLWLNGLLVLACAVVVLGTFYPMIFTAMGWGSISVGSPYFNRLFTPLTLLLCLAMGLATVWRWQKNLTKKARKVLWLLPVAALLAFGLIQWSLTQTKVHRLELLPWAFVSLAIWLILTHLPTQKSQLHFTPLAMRLAHIGFAVALIGAMMNSFYGDERGVRLKPNQSAELAGFAFHYLDYQDAIGANFTAEQAIFQISQKGKPLATVVPERRYYDVRTMTMAEVGLYHHFLDDLYIVMGDKFGNLEYAFRLHYKPFVRALWLGGLLMVLGAGLGLLGYRRKNKEQK